MLVFQRLQTIIGREIDAYELSIVARVFKTSIDFFFTEELTESWKVEPEPITYLLEIDDAELAGKITVKADEMDISPDELIIHMIKEYYADQEAAAND